MTALITGANRGIGRALLDRMPGAIGTARSDTEGYEQLDVTDPSSLKALAERLDGTQLDLLVCNAGVYLDRGQSMEKGLSGDLWARTFAANVTGVYLTIEALMPNLLRADGAKVAIISSAMGSQANAPGGSYIYRASKAAVTNLTRNLAKDFLSRGVAFGAFHPGWVQTDMGGAEADITVDVSADGLVRQFDALSLDTTGCYKTYDGSDIAL